MLFCFDDITLSECFEFCMHNLKKGDIACFNRNILYCVDLESELDGSNEVILNLARLSASTHCIFIVATRAVVGNECYNSVIVLENGKILGISDEIFAKPSFCQGNCLRCYNTSKGRIAIIVGGDFYYPQVWQKCVDGKADFILVLNPASPHTADTQLVCSMAYCTGLTVYYHCHENSCVYAPNGSLQDLTDGNYRKTKLVAYKKKNCFDISPIKLFVE